MSITPLLNPTPQSPRPTRQAAPRTYVPDYTEPTYEPMPQSVEETLPYLDPSISKRVVKRRRASSAVQTWTLRVGVFGFFTLTSFIVSSMYGQVSLEKARRLQITAKERMVAAERVKTTLQDEVYAMTDERTIRTWALSHGFIDPTAVIVPAGEHETTKVVSDLDETIGESPRSRHLVASR